MANKKQHDFVKPTGPLKKGKREIVRYDKEKKPLIYAMFKKYNLSGFQQFFDYTIISGVIYQRPEILELVRNSVDKYKKYFNEERMARLKGTPFKRVVLAQIVAQLYQNDQEALNRFVIEMNIRKQWLFRIMLEDGLVAESPAVIDLIKRCQDANITERKKTVARLLDDKYVSRLSIEDSDAILSKLTEEYDNQIFDDTFEALMKFKTDLNEKLASQKEEEEFDKEFEERLQNLRKSRARNANVLLEPIDED